MKASPSAAVGLVVALLYFSPPVTAGGTLEFVDLENYITHHIPPGNDTFRSVSTSDRGGFKFGDKVIDRVFVSTNGYFSMDESPHYETLPNFPLPNSYSIVAPFAADIDTTYTGSVQYTDFTSDYNSYIIAVTSFINSEIDNEYIFSAASMMVVEWNTVPKHSQSSTVNNTFQGILITDGTDSYAVFIYECGGMEWGGGVIGWQASPSHYASHSRSADSQNSNIGCLYSSSYSAVVYKLTIPTQSPSEVPCVNGVYMSQSNTSSDYGDNSTYGQACEISPKVTPNIPVIVGSAIGIFLFVLAIGTYITLVVVGVCVYIRRSSRQKHVGTSTPTTTSTTTSAIENESQTAPLLDPGPVAYTITEIVDPQHHQIPIEDCGLQQNAPSTARATSSTS